MNTETTSVGQPAQTDELLALRPNELLGAWQPIETAPSNTKVLVTRFPACGRPPINLARFSTKALRNHEFPWKLSAHKKLRYRPTHWMPLPDPPIRISSPEIPDTSFDSSGQ